MHLINVENLKKVYHQKGKHDITAVNGISFSIEAGEIVGLLGPNGAGKTTTIKSICGLVLPTAGRISIGDIDIVKNLQKGMEKITAVLEGNRNIFWRLTVRENLTFFAGLMGIPYRKTKQHLDELIVVFHLQDKTDTQARFLSKGMQQKLAIACALAKQTDIVLLDEPTLGLDVESSYELRKLIKDLSIQRGKTVLISSHDMKVVEEVCERVIIINKGTLVAENTVRNLRNLFQVKSYRFTLEETVSTILKDKINQRFALSKITDNEGKTTIDIEFLEAQDFYILTEILRENNCKIVSVENITPDFEEIYLQIVKEK
ncbi:MAG: ABC transporter ATP-binding protein [Planctomycetota bacterium]